jgi:hypothetical protein
MLFGVKANVGSNPTVTASENPRETGGFLHSQELRGAFLVHISRHSNHGEMRTPTHKARRWSQQGRQDPSLRRRKLHLGQPLDGFGSHPAPFLVQGHPQLRGQDIAAHMESHFSP